MTYLPRKTAGRRIALSILGLLLIIAALYQNFVLKLPYFYALFSVGMSLLLYALYQLSADRPLFRNWNLLHLTSFAVLLIAACISIDHLGMTLGYWEYPHYDSSDTARKYIFEWAVALFYHLLSLLLGMRLFMKAGFEESSSFSLAMVLFVTPVGFLTEFLNLHVYSWRVLSMPFTDFRIGEYFIVFQTLGYWLMAAIPYLLFLMVDNLAGNQGSKSRDQVLKRNCENG